MNVGASRRLFALGTLVMTGTLAPAFFCASGSLALAGLRSVAPEQVLPMEMVPAQYREVVAEIIRDNTLHRKGAADAFPCHSGLYLNLLNEPLLTLPLWKDLSDTPVHLRQVAPGRYEGSDGSGASATWEIVLKTNRFNVFLCQLDYVSPKGNIRLQGRVVMIARFGFYREVNGEDWVRHDVEAFVKIDSKGWKTLAKTVRPILEAVLKDQVEEAGLFVSLMGRLVETYPNWACRTVSANPAIDPAIRQSFCEVVTKNRRPGASDSRPIVMDEPVAAAGSGGSRARRR